MKKAALALALVAGLVGPEFASAQGGPGFLFRNPRVSLGLRVGYQMPRASSDIFDFPRDELTLSTADFGSLLVGAELAIRIEERWDVALTTGWSRSRSDSEYRNWVGTDDLPIEQKTTFETVSGSVGFKYYLTERGRSIGRFAWVPARLTPFVGAGAGFVYYEFEQVGEFIDFQSPTSDIVFDRVGTTGTGPAAYAAAGANLSLGKQLVLTSEARYNLANGPVRDAFTGFERIDLAGLQLTAGIALRW